MQKAKFVLLFIFLIKGYTPLLAQETDRVKVTLQALFDMADQNNRDLKILDYDQMIAEEAVVTEKKKRLPSLDASLSFSYNGDGRVIDRNFGNSMKAPIPDFGNSFVLEASQVIYAGGAIKNSIELAKLNQNLSSLNKEELKQNIRFSIAGYYLEILKLKNQKKILEQNIIQTKALLTEMKAKYEQGTMLSNNVTRYELQLQSLDVSLLQTGNQITKTNNELVKMMQLPAGTVLLLDENIITDFLNGQNNEEWKEEAANNSPLLKQSQVKIDQARKAEKLVRADNMPQILAVAANNLNGPITIEVPAIDKNFNYWYVGVSVKYNIASLYKNKSKKNSAKLATRLSIENSEKVKDDLANEIDDAFIDYREAIKVYESQLKNVELATENYRVIKNRYLNDLVLITEMLDAENSKLDADLKATNAQINIIFNHYKLKKLTGTL